MLYRNYKEKTFSEQSIKIVGPTLTENYAGLPAYRHNITDSNMLLSIDQLLIVNLLEYPHNICPRMSIKTLIYFLTYFSHIL